MSLFVTPVKAMVLDVPLALAIAHLAIAEAVNIALAL